MSVGMCARVYVCVYESKAAVWAGVEFIRHTSKKLTRVCARYGRETETGWCY